MSAKAADEDLYREVREFIAMGGQLCISTVQRRFKIGWNRSYRMFERMADDGMIVRKGMVLGVQQYSRQASGGTT